MISQELLQADATLRLSTSREFALVVRESENDTDSLFEAEYAGDGSFVFRESGVVISKDSEIVEKLSQYLLEILESIRDRRLANVEYDKVIAIDVALD